MKKIIIFDLDGTILNSLGGIFYSIKETLKHFGYKIKEDTSKLKASLGFGPRHLISSYLPDNIKKDKLDEILDYYTKFYKRNYLVDSVPYKGIEELLETLLKEGYLLIIASNKQEAVVLNIIKKLFPGKFKYVIGSKKGLKLKPSTEMFSSIKNLISSNRTIFIGDTEVDYETSRNLGVTFIGCAYGFRDVTKLIESGVDLIAKTPKDIKALIDKLYKGK